MSRNFELLTQLGGAEAVIPVAQTVIAVPQAVTHGQNVRPAVAAAIPAESAPDELIKLVQNVFFMSGDQSPKAVAFSCVEDRYGSERICAQAAEILAGSGNGKVCLVDAISDAQRCTESTAWKMHWV